MPMFSFGLEQSEKRSSALPFKVKDDSFFELKKKSEHLTSSAAVFNNAALVRRQPGPNLILTLRVLGR